MKKSAKKILLGSGIAAAGLSIAGAVSYAITDRLVKIALDREVPRIVGGSPEKLTGSSGEENDFSAELSACSEKLENSGCELVEITSHDGQKLVGHWAPCDHPRRILIAMHGWRSSWTRDFGAIADFWRENQCSVLYAEQRGQNNSGGDYMGFGLIERYDCLDWIHWVNETMGTGLPIYLCGISMGATTVLMTAGLPLPENVHGIMADCGFTSPHAIWKHVVENNLHMAYTGLRSAMVDDLCRRKIQMGANDYSTLEAMKEGNVPVLFIHGTDDHFVPIEMTYENYKACTAPKRLLVVPGAEHGMSYLVDQTGYETAVQKFWAEFDAWSPASPEETAR